MNLKPTDGLRRHVVVNSILLVTMVLVGLVLFFVVGGDAPALMPVEVGGP